MSTNSISTYAATAKAQPNENKRKTSAAENNLTSQQKKIKIEVEVKKEQQDNKINQQTKIKTEFIAKELKNVKKANKKNKSKQQENQTQQQAKMNTKAMVKKARRKNFHIPFWVSEEKKNKIMEKAAKRKNFIFRPFRTRLWMSEKKKNKFKQQKNQAKQHTKIKTQVTAKESKTVKQKNKPKQQENKTKPQTQIKAAVTPIESKKMKKNKPKQQENKTKPQSKIKAAVMPKESKKMKKDKPKKQERKTKQQTKIKTVHTTNEWKKKNKQKKLNKSRKKTRTRAANPEKWNNASNSLPSHQTGLDPGVLSIKQEIATPTRTPRFLINAIPEVPLEVHAERNDDIECTERNFLIAVVPRYFPDVQLNGYCSTKLQQMLVKAVDSIPYQSFVPRFHEAFLHQGALVVNCWDDESRNWIQTQVKIIKACEDVELEVASVWNILNLKFVTMCIPAPVEKVNVVLERLYRQNSRLKTSLWRVFSKKVDRSGANYELTIAIDDSSMAVLRELQFKPCFGLGRVAVKLHDPEIKRERLPEIMVD